MTATLTLEPRIRTTRTRQYRPDDSDSGPRVHVARRIQEVVEAWRLVHDVYASTGLINANRYRIHTAPQWVDPNTAVFSCRFDGRIMATLSAIVDGPAALPLDYVYGDELDTLRAEGRRLVECGLFVHAAQLEATSFAGAMFQVGSCVRHLMANAFHYGVRHGVTDFLIGVHPKHQTFYTRGFGFLPYGNQRTYPVVNDRPVVLMRGNLEAVFRLRRRPWAVDDALGIDVSESSFDQRFGFEPQKLHVLGAYLSHKFPGFAPQLLAAGQ